MRHDKRTRQALIQAMVQTYAIETQEELAELLAERGIPATQATVSRDIKELGLLKVPYQDRHRYALPSSPTTAAHEKFRRIMREVLVDVVVSENLVVVKTLPAGANVVSEAIDGMNWEDVAGTLAGDNTVLVVARSRAEAPLIADRLKALR
ncbi:MAG: arginine repressor [Firmicutes bacterium]|jgi:transcriptional regulator of arginine metabolism|nr:arginine repressor [Bacillota bacterium]